MNLDDLSNHIIGAALMVHKCGKVKLMRFNGNILKYMIKKAAL